MKAQDLFDIVVTHLYTQGHAAKAYLVDEDRVGCAYRGDNGTSCAVGCLIPDEDYDLRMESKPVSAQYLPTFLVPHFSLLRSLQNAHDTEDSAAPREDMAPTIAGRLRVVAQRHGLAYREEHYPRPPAEWK